MTVNDLPVLAITADLELPIDVVTQVLAIVGRRGSGKTSTAVVLAENMIPAQLLTVVLDPLGVWHGLRSSADGRGPGLPVVIFGGDHADVPLQPGTGALVADVVVDERLPAVIDLSGFDSDAEIRRWCAAFLRRLYHRNRDPLHVIVDEADLLAPQQGSGEASHSLNALKTVARRGRVRGLGATLITQRPAALAKEVLNQAELLIALQLTGPRDVAAVDEWMSQHGDPDQVRTVKASLPALAAGESWWWSPSWLRRLVRVQMPPRTTFDSSATPRPGETRPTLQQMATVDLARITARLAALDAGTDPDGDPQKLRARAGQNEQQPAAPVPTPQPITREVPTVTDQDREDLGRWTTSASALVTSLSALIDLLAVRIDAIDARLASAGPGARDVVPADPGGPRPPAKPTEGPPPAVAKPAATSLAPIGDPRPARRRPRRLTSAPDPELPAPAPALRVGARRILAALGRQHPQRVSRAQLAALSGFSARSGTFSTYLSDLRRAELMEDVGDQLALTAAGAAATDASSAPRPPDELLAQYRSVLRAGARAMLDHVVAISPDTVRRDELAAAVNLSASSGTFSTYLSDLRRPGLITVSRDGTIAMGETLLALAPATSGKVDR